MQSNITKTEVLVLNVTAEERTMGDFQGFLQRKEDLRHSYEKFRFAGGVNKPPFDAVYREVKIYLKDVLPKEASKEDADGGQQ